MEELLLVEEQVPEPLRSWLADQAQPVGVVAIERLPDGYVVLRGLPAIDAALIARVRVTFAQYREALMNLT